MGAGGGAGWWRAGLVGAAHRGDLARRRAGAGDAGVAGRAAGDRRRLAGRRHRRRALAAHLRGAPGRRWVHRVAGAAARAGPAGRGRLARGARGDGRRVDRRRALARPAPASAHGRARCLVGRVCRRRRRCRRPHPRRTVPGHPLLARRAAARRAGAGARPRPAPGGPRRPRRPRTPAGPRVAPGQRAPRGAPRPRGSRGAARHRHGRRHRAGRAVVERGLDHLDGRRGGRPRWGRARPGPGRLAAQPRPVGRVLPRRPGLPGGRGRLGQLVGVEGRPAADGARARGPAAARCLPVVHRAVGARRRRRRCLRRAACPRARSPGCRGCAPSWPSPWPPAPSPPSPSRVLDLVAGGSLGQFRLSAVGAPTGRLFLALLLELGLGAVVVVVRDAWKLRR